MRVLTLLNVFFMCDIFYDKENVLMGLKRLIWFDIYIEVEYQTKDLFKIKERVTGATWLAFTLYTLIFLYTLSEHKLNIKLYSQMIIYSLTKITIHVKNCDI